MGAGKSEEYGGKLGKERERVTELKGFLNSPLQPFRVKNAAEKYWELRKIS